MLRYRRGDFCKKITSKAGAYYNADDTLDIGTEDGKLQLADDVNAITKV